MMTQATAKELNDNVETDAPQDQLNALAALCKASADPLRLQILRALQKESFGVLELSSLFGMRQPAMSHHLKVLSSAGLLATRREGNSIFYRRDALGQSPALRALTDELLATVDRIDLPTEAQQAVDQLHRTREENSRSFFRLNAHKFQEQQDLIASYEQYAQTVSDALRDAMPARRDVALEIGPGDGSFLEELSPHFKRVFALDNAAEMLERARGRARDLNLGNIEFIHGDTTDPAIKELSADCIVVNMVLHHTPRPGDIFRDVAACLAPDGVVLVTDLCSHDQAWARENCGDLWLGFEPDELSRWASDAGLADSASVYLAQRNGFQIQVRLFGHRKT